MDYVRYTADRPPISVGQHHPRLTIYPTTMDRCITEFCTFNPALDLAASVLESKPGWTATIFPTHPKSRDTNRLCTHFLSGARILGQVFTALPEFQVRNQYSFVGRQVPYQYEFKSLSEEKGFMSLDTALKGVRRICAKDEKVSLERFCLTEYNKTKNKALIIYNSLNTLFTQEMSKVISGHDMFGPLKDSDKLAIVRGLPQLINQLNIVSPSLHRQLSDCITLLDASFNALDVLIPILRPQHNRPKPIWVMRLDGRYHFIPEEVCHVSPQGSGSRCVFDPSELPPWVTIAVESLSMAPMARENSPHKYAVVEGVGMTVDISNAAFVGAKYVLILPPIQS